MAVRHPDAFLIKPRAALFISFCLSGFVHEGSEYRAKIATNNRLCKIFNGVITALACMVINVMNE